jgi:Na+/proline symporter
MIPFSVLAVGGFHALHEKVSANASYDMFSLVAPKGITFFWIAMVVVNGAINWAVQPHVIPSSTANRTEMDARVGVTYGNFIKRFCTVAWAFTGIAAMPLIPGLKNPDNAFGEMAALLLPVGLVGLLISSLLATIQSTGVVLMISGSSIFVRNFYAVYFRKKTESHYLLIGRVVSFLIVVGSLAFALLLPGVIKALELFMQIPALIGISFWMGIIWRRANPASAWASFIAATGVFLYCELAQDMRLPWQMVCYLSAGIITGILVGLVTPPQQKEKLNRFYTNLKTPVDEEERLASDTVA